MQQLTLQSPVGTEEPKPSIDPEMVNQSEILIQEEMIVGEPSDADEVDENTVPIPASALIKLYVKKGYLLVSDGNLLLDMVKVLKDKQ